MHGEYDPRPRDIGVWRDRLARQSRVSRALQAQRVADKHEPEWLARAKRGELKAKDYTRY